MTQTMLDQLIAAERSFGQGKGLDVRAHNKLIAAREKLQAPDLDDPRTQTALWVVAPCLAAFGLWIRDQTKQAAHPCFVGVMREGRLLAQLLTAMFDVPARELWVNRNLALRAAFAAGDDEALLNWLTRTRLHPITRAEASLLLDVRTDSAPEDQSPLDVPQAEDLIEEWRSNGGLSKIKAKSQTIMDRLLCHWDDVTANASEVFLLDFACAGNIQRSLHTVFQKRGHIDPMVGLNFLTTPGVRWAKEKGCNIHGFLANAGKPSWFAEPYARTPELIEIFTAAPIGALNGYAPSGAPILAPDVLPAQQKEWVEKIQPELIKAACFYATQMEADLSADLTRCLWGRTLIHPLQAEAEAFGQWQLDGGIDGRGGRILAPPPIETLHDAFSRRHIAWPAAAQLLHGINTQPDS